jgi:phosphoribosylformimino-5-aminoimidazole carboxamide ribotide isomerase
MEFRPCIDIHNGAVKQIVGSSLRDEGDFAKENFKATQDAAYYASLYRDLNLRGGHVILLNKEGSRYYEETKKQAFLALSAYPDGLQVGGGIHAQNACQYLEAGASHVIVTSYVFCDGKIQYENLEKICSETGKEHLVLDLSCRKKDGEYHIVTDRWQKYTDVVLNEKTLNFFADYCDEFLIHAVDVEGKAQGIELELVRMLGRFGRLPITYAGGVHDYEDLLLLKEAGGGRVNVTIGSALEIFGGTMKLSRVLEALA